MNKIIIPSILAATILVAGMFAFMPVEKASTVHGVLTGIRTVTKTDTDVNAADTVSVTCNQPFVVRTVQTAISNAAAADITGDARSDADGAGGTFVEVTILSNVNLGATAENVVDAALPANGELKMVFETEAGNTSNEALTAHFVIEVSGTATCS